MMPAPAQPCGRDTASQIRTMSTDVEEKLRALRDQYARRLPDKIATFAAKWAAACDHPDDPAPFRQLLRELHTLAGSGASFGFPAISRLARLAEQSLQQQLDTPAGLASPARQAEVAELLERLAEAAQAAGAAESGTADGPAPHAIHLQIADPDERAQLAHQLELYGHEVRTFEHLAAMAESEAIPALRVVELASPGATEALSRIGSLRRQDEDCPLIVIAGDADIAARLQAVRLGAAAFFPRPVDTDRFIDTVDKLLHLRAQDPFRILIVDDDHPAADLYAGTLRQAGMLTRVVTHPDDVLEQMREFNPELVLLDLNLPGCHGTELAAVIRQCEAHVSTPIVFLSAERDIAYQLETIRQGGDDLLIKPIAAAHLVSAVQGRAARYRLLRSFMVRDSLTGLYNHASTKELLQRELARARRNGTLLSFAMLDLDHFKRINDAHGHAVGDAVLRLLARTLRQRLRATDIVGRHGGEEFAVILPECTAENARKVIDGIRERFARLAIPAGEDTLHVHFSAGIAAYPEWDTDYQLSEQADRALYAAKAAGRNRVMISTARTAP